MERLPTPVLTSRARFCLQWDDPELDRVHQALLSTIDGHRNVIQLESVVEGDGTCPIGRWPSCARRASSAGRAPANDPASGAHAVRQHAANHREDERRTAPGRTTRHDVGALGLDQQAERRHPMPPR